MDGIDRATTLYYSDDPETLSDSVQGHIDGVLFDFDIVSGDPQRFLLYHVNADGAPRTLAVRFFNTGTSNARVSYVKSLPPGSADYVQVGHASTFGFLQALSSGTARVVNVAPNQNVVAESITLNQNALASGIFEFTLIVGTTLRCSLVSVSDPADVVATARAGATFRPDGFGRRGKFDISDKSPVLVSANVGTSTIVARLGQRLLPNLAKGPGGTAGNPLKGEYGVFTAIVLTIVNTTSAAANVALYESAHGGTSTASYLVDGVPAQSGAMQSTNPYPRYKVATYAIPAHAKVTSHILTMPDSASNSPVVLALDADDAAIADPNTAGSIVSYVRPVVAPAAADAIPAAEASA